LADERRADIVEAIVAEYRRYKALGDAAFAQLDEPQLSEPGPNGGNSIAVLVWHVSGNLASRFTDFRTSDGEKPWRVREEEFDDRMVTRAQLAGRWEGGWSALFRALDALTDADLAETVTIRRQPLRIDQALLRSLAHTAYHVGQIVYLAKALKGDGWKTLSIPRGGSQAYNDAPVFETASAHAAALSTQPGPITIAQVAASSADARALMQELDEELERRYPGKPTFGLRHEDEADPETIFLIAHVAGQAAACGASRRCGPAEAEIKRMYVRPPFRRTGLGRRILSELESLARGRGIARVVLETGDGQPEAIALYRSSGYIDIPRFGEYAGNEGSRCFEKKL
jgi:GNAT superfamily N-acetyltransferase